MSTERRGELSNLLGEIRAGGANARDRLVVDLRFFGGLSVPEVAELLGVSDTTVEGDWRFARAWLRRKQGGTNR
jgi:RNA polymerase sigma factor (sigma-70 family)